MSAVFDLTGRTALITGSVRGIGFALAEGLCNAGATVIVNGRKQDAVDEAVAKLRAKGFQARGAVFDVAEESAVVAAFENFDRDGVEIDILINNAGIQFVAPVDEFPVAKWDQIIAINLTSNFHSIRAALPIMKAQKHGRIINIASAHGLVASPFKSAYVSAKHGVLGLTKTVALEIAEAGITCNAICPGYVHTPLVDGQIKDTAKARGMTEDQVVRDVILAAQPSKQFITFEQLCGLMLYLASDAGGGVNGAHLSIDGGWTAG